jgi:hypothetical protein
MGPTCPSEPGGVFQVGEDKFVVGPPCVWCERPAVIAHTMWRRSRPLSIPACERHENLAYAAAWGRVKPERQCKVEQPELFDVPESRFVGDAVAHDE